MPIKTKGAKEKIDVYARAEQFTGISEEMDKRLSHIAQRTWDYIGYDVISACMDDGRNTMKRSDVIEVVCDAGYMHMYGNDDEAYAYYLYLLEKNEKHLAKVMKEAFPFKYYGM
jgi:hypothetical protein